jgi:hypothetical protein
LNADTNFGFAGTDSMNVQLEAESTAGDLYGHSYRRSAYTTTKRLADRVRSYLADHPEVTTEEFLRSAVRREIAHRVRVEHNVATRIAAPLSEDDLRLHAGLAQRTLALHPQPRSVWERLQKSVHELGL